ncbi:MAG TPA: acylphosphatase [Steroidobacteraceae bacterium]|jgi:acylphosphatase|nr:acylphosphatase [Steroidobacteraceae bacterium]
MSDSSRVGGNRVVRRCLVSGRVQGVFYRASAAERARAVGITGHARNLPDGRVEVLVCGSDAAVDEFIAWLWIGPAAAKVSEVASETIELALEELPERFRTG